MKLTQDTITILKNFSKINPSLLFKEGNTLETISPSKSVYAKASIPDTFEKRFAINKLNEFISILSLFSDPELEITDKIIVISDSSGKKVNYTVTEESHIIFPQKEVKFTSIDATFDLKFSDYETLTKALGILDLQQIAIVGDGKSLFLQGFNSDDVTSHVYSFLLGESSQNFKAVFKKDNIKIIPGDYKVSISSKGISCWDTTTAVHDNSIRYFIALEKDSKFN